MPPILELILTLFGCTFLIWRDSRRATPLTAALWLPVIWIFFIGSRFPTQWLQLFGISAGGEGSLEDGNPIDALFFVLLILAGTAVLIGRRVSLMQFIRN